MKTNPRRKLYASDDARWRAVQGRDARADAHFVYAVRTTGVYGRPSSSARRPRRENVEFFDSPEDAEAAGYRPSHRHRSDSTSAAAERAARIAESCRQIEATDSHLSLEELATRAGLSPFHFHKVFKAETGLTPKAYTRAAQARRVREELSCAKTVTRAIHGSGFSSSSRFYEASDGMLGMRAQDYRAGGAGLAIRFAVGQCSLGAVLVAQSARGICAIFLGEDPDRLIHELQDQFPRAELLGGERDFERLVAQVVGFIETPALGLNLPLDIRGTAFQERVWRALSEIPVGETVSYAELAQRIGAPRAVRAVAQACGKNRLAVAIPCHRVVRLDGALSGYRWGVERKRELLKRESRTALPIP